MKLSPNEIAYVAKQAGFAGSDLVTAVAVVLAESGGDTDALGRSSSGASIGNRDHGLAQISNRWHGDKLTATPNWRDPETNMRMAFKVYTDAGKKFEPWSVFTSGAHLIYMPDAEIAVTHPIPPPSFYTELGKQLES